LQLRKGTLNDIEIIFDICWILNPAQISKLINQYSVADYEQPIQPEILKAVANRVIQDQEDVLLLDAVSLAQHGDYVSPEARSLDSPSTYIPSWLQVPHLRRLSQLAAAREETNTNALGLS